MTSLADHYGKMGNWLPVGDHQVVVESYKATERSKKNNEGIEFRLVAHGQLAKAAFWLTDAAMGHLANFAEACGIPQNSEEARRYDPYIFQSHRVLVGRHLNIRVVKDGDYHEVTSFWALSEEAPAYADPTPARAQAPAETETPPDDDIPF